jgi:hypothetical protein
VDQQSPALAGFLQVENQIQIGRLAFKDNSLLDDAALRKKAIRALLCYHPFWLCLGMETVLNRRMFHDPSAAERGVTGDHDLEAVLREEFLSDSSLLVCSHFLLSVRSVPRFLLQQAWQTLHAVCKAAESLMRRSAPLQAKNLHARTC